MSTLKLPKIGLGTMMANSNKAKRGLIKGIEIGFRFLDTAQMYFNEKTVGAAVKESGVPREEFIIATKLWISNFKPKKVFKSTTKSLNKLGLDYIDILYLHWPYKFNKVGDTLKAMNKLVDEGQIRHIAVSNYNPEHIDEALTLCDKPIVANQVEMHPWLQQKELLAHHKDKNVNVIAYFPIMHGNINKVSELRKIADKHKVSVFQVSLAWIMKKGAIPIPKSATESHLIDNFASLKLKLDTDDVKLIDSITINKRLLKVPFIAPKNW